MKATIEKDGSVNFKGESFQSLSAAANRAKARVTRKPHASDGWLWWRFQDLETGKLQTVTVLRERYLARKVKKK